MPHDVLAATFLAALALAPLAALVIAMRRTRYTLPQMLLWCAALCLTRILWRAKLPGRVPLSLDQGAVVVCNHRSSVDPFFVQVCSRRPIHWMVAQEYCRHPAFRWFLTTCAVIPVNRGGIDTAATKAAIRLAAAGGAVGMFPEGRINMSDDFMLPVRPGAVLVALKARVPILPCYISGSPFAGTPWSPFFRSAKARVQFGELIDLSPYYDRQEDQEAAASITLQVVHALAVLAGQGDFQPCLAGRRWMPSEEELRRAALAHAKAQGGT